MSEVSPVVAVTFAANQATVGGGEVMLLRTAKAALTAGYDVSVVGPAAPGGVVEQAAVLGANPVALKVTGRGDYARALRAWDARHRADLLWCHGLLPALATVGRSHRVVHVHQHPQSKFQTASLLAARQRADVLVNSHFVATTVPNSRVLWNWTDTPRPRDHNPGDIAVVGFLGRLSSDKGVVDLCEAVAVLLSRDVRVRLLIAGESRFVAPADASRVQTALSALGDHVEHVGWIARDDFFDAVDIAVFPSRWQEPFGLVVAEAMAANVPVVVSDAGGISEVVGVGFSYMSRAGDVQSLTETLSRALQELPTPAMTFTVKSSHDRWLANFSPEQGEARFLAELERATGNGVYQ
ncbi:glycosyltransferase family 4 protein [Ornithinimicrobium sp. Arc0846-15]|nr:glycosyltransferase family 4 protein [Ornithinimicrobium laminariae]